LPLVGGAPTDAALVELVAVCKYRGVRGLASALAELVERALADVVCDRARAADGAGVILVPVPLHSRRKRSRGFNQAALIAGLVAERRGLSCRCDLVVRRRATPQQAQLPSTLRARRANVIRAFAAGPAPVGGANPRPVIVDDLVTTGATVVEVAEALGAAGWRPLAAIAAGLAPDGTGDGRAAAGLDNDRNDF
jgi:predicted amidophosphoribosyltransferase